MDLLSGKILGFMLVVTRVGAFFMTSPVFSWKAISTRTRIAASVLVSVFFATVNNCPVKTEEIHLLDVILLLANELIYGAALGYVTMMLFSAVRLGARICERQMGLSMANILDPLSGENAQPLAMIMEMIFILLFLSANGHHILLITISKSYETFPMTTIPDIERLAESVIVSGSTMLMLGLKLTVPILAAFMLLMVVLAVLARIAPETNILFLSLPLRVGMGLVMVSIFLPFVNEFVAEFAQWMDKIIPI
jgi:flagellar biosynthetic protein FliR